jgi:hypothetical protein
METPDVRTAAPIETAAQAHQAKDNAGMQVPVPSAEEFAGVTPDLLAHGQSMYKQSVTPECSGGEDFSMDAASSARGAGGEAAHDMAPMRGEIAMSSPTAKYVEETVRGLGVEQKATAAAPTQKEVSGIASGSDGEQRATAVASGAIVGSEVPASVKDIPVGLPPLASVIPSAEQEEETVIKIVAQAPAPSADEVSGAATLSGQEVLVSTIAQGVGAEEEVSMPATVSVGEGSVEGASLKVTAVVEATLASPAGSGEKAAVDIAADTNNDLVAATSADGAFAESVSLAIVSDSAVEMAAAVPINSTPRQDEHAEVEAVELNPAPLADEVAVATAAASLSGDEQDVLMPPSAQAAGREVEFRIPAGTSAGGAGEEAAPEVAPAVRETAMSLPVASVGEEDSWRMGEAQEIAGTVLAKKSSVDGTGQADRELEPPTPGSVSITEAAHNTKTAQEDSKVHDGGVAEAPAPSATELAVTAAAICEHDQNVHMLPPSPAAGSEESFNIPAASAADEVSQEISLAAEETVLPSHVTSSVEESATGMGEEQKAPGTVVAAEAYKDLVRTASANDTIVEPTSPGVATDWEVEIATATIATPSAQGQKADEVIFVQVPAPSADVVAVAAPALSGAEQNVPGQPAAPVAGMEAMLRIIPAAASTCGSDGEPASGMVSNIRDVATSLTAASAVESVAKGQGEEQVSVGAVSAKQETLVSVGEDAYDEHEATAPAAVEISELASPAAVKISAATFTDAPTPSADVVVVADDAVLSRLAMDVPVPGGDVKSDISAASRAVGAEGEAGPEMAPVLPVLAVRVGDDDRWGLDEEQHASNALLAKRQNSFAVTPKADSDHEATTPAAAKAMAEPVVSAVVTGDVLEVLDMPVPVLVTPATQAQEAGDCVGVQAPAVPGGELAAVTPGLSGHGQDVSLLPSAPVAGEETKLSMPAWTSPGGAGIEAAPELAPTVRDNPLPALAGSLCEGGAVGLNEKQEAAVAVPSNELSMSVVAGDYSEIEATTFANDALAQSASPLVEDYAVEMALAAPITPPAQRQVADEGIVCQVHMSLAGGVPVALPEPEQDLSDLASAPIKVAQHFTAASTVEDHASGLGQKPEDMGALPAGKEILDGIGADGEAELLVATDAIAEPASPAALMTRVVGKADAAPISHPPPLQQPDEEGVLYTPAQSAGVVTVAAPQPVVDQDAPVHPPTTVGGGEVWLSMPVATCSGEASGEVVTETTPAEAETAVDEEDARRVCEDRDAVATLPANYVSADVAAEVNSPREAITEVTAVPSPLSVPKDGTVDVAEMPVAAEHVTSSGLQRFPDMSGDDSLEHVRDINYPISLRHLDRMAAQQATDITARKAALLQKARELHDRKAHLASLATIIGQFGKPPAVPDVHEAEQEVDLLAHQSSIYDDMEHLSRSIAMEVEELAFLTGEDVDQLSMSMALECEMQAPAVNAREREGVPSQSGHAVAHAVSPSVSTPSVQSDSVWARLNTLPREMTNERGSATYNPEAGRVPLYSDACVATSKLQQQEEDTVCHPQAVQTSSTAQGCEVGNGRHSPSGKSASSQTAPRMATAILVEAGYEVRPQWITADN